MTDQNFSNHIRYDSYYHFITTPLITVGLIGSIVNLFNCTPNTCYGASLIVLIFIVLLFLTALLRVYALRVQDRAIRAEESLRHFILTGKPIDRRLRLGQIIALRFASDEELAELAQAAVEEGLNGKQIKMAIRLWKPDNHRI
jgi:hypothetical protein